MTIAYREAKEADAEGIARVHVASWRTTYAGLIPDETLANLSEERRVEGWRESIRREANFVLVAEDDGEIVGFAAGGPEREETARQSDGLLFDAELYAIYLLAEHQGRGIGARLFRMLAEALFMAGFRRMLLWVLTENTSARRFYEALGGTVEPSRMVKIVGVDLEETGYGWDLPL